MSKSRVFVGFDGSVDRTLRPIFKNDVEKQYFDTIGQFGSYIVSKAGLSCSVQLDPVMTRAGGNAQYVSSALCAFGFDVTLTGMMGEDGLLPEFWTLEEAGVKCLSFAAPSFSDCYEFNDGKIMLAPLAPQIDNAFELVLNKLSGLEELEDSELIALLNWGEIKWMQQLWDSVIAALDRGEKDSEKFVFFDLADISCRSVEDVKELLETLRRACRCRHCVISLNENELLRLGEAAFDGINEPEELLKRIVSAGYADEAVVHTLQHALCWDGKQMYESPTDYVAKPLISTGAGDNFNAGYCAGLLWGYSPLKRLDTANLSSHEYVISGKAADPQLLQRKAAQ